MNDAIIKTQKLPKRFRNVIAVDGLSLTVEQGEFLGLVGPVGERIDLGGGEVCMNSRIIPIMRKEFIHIRRDPRTLTFMFLIPVIQLGLLSSAASTDVEHLSTAVLDYDRTSASRELIDSYQASNYFDITFYIEDEEEMARLIDGGKVRAGMIIDRKSVV